MAIDYTKLLNKLSPQPGGEDVLRLRTGIVDSVNDDGTVNVGISGVVVPNVPQLSSANVADSSIVQVISYRGSLLIVGDVASGGGQGGSLGLRRSTAATSSTETTFLKDGGCGDLDFAAVSGRRYQVSYRARMSGNTTGTAGDVRILDGGASSPTNASTAIAAAHCPIANSAGWGQANVVVDGVMDCPTHISAGVHTIAAFYGRTAGAAGNTVALGQSTGQTRTLWVQDLGSIFN